VTTGQLVQLRKTEEQYSVLTQIYRR